VYVQYVLYVPESKVPFSGRCIARGSKSLAVFLSESVLSRMLLPETNGRDVRSGITPLEASQERVYRTFYLFSKPTPFFNVHPSRAGDFLSE